MLKNILQLYALFICAFIVIVAFIISGLTISNLTELAFPEYKNYSSLERYESNEAYLSNGYGAPLTEQERNALKKLSPQDLTEKRLNARKMFLESERIRMIQSLITSCEWALVALVFFLIHWRLYKRATRKD
jgi:hypothetical protein